MEGSCHAADVRGEATATGLQVALGLAMGGSSHAEDVRVGAEELGLPLAASPDPNPAPTPFVEQALADGVEVDHVTRYVYLSRSRASWHQLAPAAMSSVTSRRRPARKWQRL